MMRNCRNLDERQLLQRGDVFQHAFLFLSLALGINAFLKEEDIVWAEGKWENMLILWAALTLCFCEFIFREITPMRKSMGAFYSVLGAAGFFILLLCGFDVARGESVFIAGNALTSCGSEILQACLMIFIFFTFLGKKLYNIWKGEKEDEE